MKMREYELHEAIRSTIQDLLTEASDTTADEKKQATKQLDALEKKAKTWKGKLKHMDWADDPEAALGALYAKAGKDPKKEVTETDDMSLEEVDLMKHIDALNQRRARAKGSIVPPPPAEDEDRDSVDPVAQALKATDSMLQRRWRRKGIPSRGGVAESKIAGFAHLPNEVTRSAVRRLVHSVRKRKGLTEGMDATDYPGGIPSLEYFARDIRNAVAKVADADQEIIPHLMPDNRKVQKWYQACLDVAREEGVTDPGGFWWACSVEVGDLIRDIAMNDMGTRVRRVYAADYNALADAVSFHLEDTHPRDAENYSASPKVTEAVKRKPSKTKGGSVMRVAPVEKLGREDLSWLADKVEEALDDGSAPKIEVGVWPKKGMLVLPMFVDKREVDEAYRVIQNAGYRVITKMKIETEGGEYPTGELEDAWGLVIGV